MEIKPNRIEVNYASNSYLLIEMVTLAYGETGIGIVSKPMTKLIPFISYSVQKAAEEKNNIDSVKMGHEALDSFLSGISGTLDLWR